MTFFPSKGIARLGNGRYNRYLSFKLQTRQPPTAHTKRQKLSLSLSFQTKTWLSLPFSESLQQILVWRFDSPNNITLSLIYGLVQTSCVEYFDSNHNRNDNETSLIKTASFTHSILLPYASPSSIFFLSLVSGRFANSDAQILNVVVLLVLFLLYFFNFFKRKNE